MDSRFHDDYMEMIGTSDFYEDDPFEDLPGDHYSPYQKNCISDSTDEVSVNWEDTV